MAYSTGPIKVATSQSLASTFNLFIGNYTGVTSLVINPSNFDAITIMINMVSGATAAGTFNLQQSMFDIANNSYGTSVLIAGQTQTIAASAPATTYFNTTLAVDFLTINWTQTGGTGTCDIYFLGRSTGGPAGRV
jgi:hypothetical protein